MVRSLHPLDQLTVREFELLLGLAEGETGLEIAERLGISATTLSKLRNSVLGKLQARNAAHAVALAYHCGLLVPRRGAA